MVLIECSDEADQVVARIRQAVSDQRFNYKDVAVFVRMNALTRTLESAFIKHGVPFQIVKGVAYFERKENKDILAYLRLLLNPNDNLSFLRAAEVWARRRVRALLREPCSAQSHH